MVSGPFLQFAEQPIRTYTRTPVQRRQYAAAMPARNPAARLEARVMPRMSRATKRSLRSVRSSWAPAKTRSTPRMARGRRWKTETISPPRIRGSIMKVDPIMRLDPAVRVMSEAGVDISGQHSKTLEELPVGEFHAVITLCDQARENCPFFPVATKRLHRAFDDPAALAPGFSDEEIALQVYRRVRNEIGDFISNLPHVLED